MFEFLQDMGNYSSRKVGRDDFEWGFISTAVVSDGDQPYETAVCSDLYQDDDGNTEEMIIVEAYNDHDSAKEGHAKWVAAMTGENPPAVLVDCLNSGICQLIGAMHKAPQQKRITHGENGS
jgi:hypothetical protein